MAAVVQQQPAPIVVFVVRRVSRFVINKLRPGQMSEESLTLFHRETLFRIILSSTSNVAIVERIPKTLRPLHSIISESSDVFPCKFEGPASCLHVPGTSAPCRRIVEPWHETKARGIDQLWILPEFPRTSLLRTFNNCVLILLTFQGLEVPNQAYFHTIFSNCQMISR